MMINGKPLTPARFDAISKPIGKLWGLPAIAEVLGVSIDTARKIARDSPDAPIYMAGNRYFAFRTELVEWLKSRRAYRGVG